MRRLQFLFALIALLGFGAEGASLIVNGSFETAPAGSPGWTLVSAPSTAIPGWTVVQGNVDWVGSYWRAQDGSSSVDLSGNTPGGIIQSVNLVVGMSYDLSFYMSGIYSPAVKRLTVRAGQFVGGAFVPGTVAESEFRYDVTAHGSNRINMRWELMTFSFTAVVPVTTIGFFSGPATTYGPALDNVSLAGVPEPGLPILFATLLLALPLARRLRKK